MDIEQVRRVKEKYAQLLLSKRNVVGCGVGYKVVGGRRTEELCVVVSVTKKLPEDQLSPDDIVPKKLDDVKTDVQETGEIRALNQSRKDRWRPAPGGVSCGHIDITAGTLGCLVKRGGEVFILSNNHVLANSNEGATGDPILQPGRYDGGTMADRIAVLEDFVPIHFERAPSTCRVADIIARSLNAAARALGSTHRFQTYQIMEETNSVDAAVARPLSNDLVEERILEIGEPKGVVQATLGMKIKKSGRTTGVTTGQIQQLHATVRVSYGENKYALFTDQLIAGAMCAGGDSGSAVLDENDMVTGLLFAGSDVSTVINPIQKVIKALDIEF